MFGLFLGIKEWEMEGAFWHGVYETGVMDINDLSVHTWTLTSYEE
jgi:hypothetical protein